MVKHRAGAIDDFLIILDLLHNLFLHLRRWQGDLELRQVFDFHADISGALHESSQFFFLKIEHEVKELSSQNIRVLRLECHQKVGYREFSGNEMDAFNVCAAMPNRRDQRNANGLPFNLVVGRSEPFLGGNNQGIRPWVGLRARMSPLSQGADIFQPDRASGRQQRESSGSSNKKVAEKLLALRTAQVLEGRWSLPRSQSPQLGIWIEEFLRLIPHEKTRSRYRSSFNNVLRHFGKNIRLTEITAESVFRFQQARLERGVGKATINRDVCTLSSCLTRAKKMRFITHNPCSDVGKLNEKRDRRQARPLTYEEEDRLKQFSPPLLRMLITLLADTGLRVKKEALPLKWDDVLLDSEPACIRIIDSKSTAGVRPVWLTNHCRDALARWRELLGPEFSAFVFPSPRNPAVHFVDYKSAWRTAAKKAGLADRRAYDLRATFASRANVCHATGLTVAHLLGHASTQILPTYVRPVDENTKALIEAMDSARKNQPVTPRSIN
jgi:integrase